jgi:hypothetical protein
MHEAVSAVARCARDSAGGPSVSRNWVRTRIPDRSVRPRPRGRLLDQILGVLGPAPQPQGQPVERRQTGERQRFKAASNAASDGGRLRLGSAGKTSVMPVAPAPGVLLSRRRNPGPRRFPPGERIGRAPGSSANNAFALGTRPSSQWRTPRPLCRERPESETGSIMLPRPATPGAAMFISPTKSWARVRSTSSSCTAGSRTSSTGGRSRSRDS